MDVDDFISYLRHKQGAAVTTSEAAKASAERKCEQKPQELDHRERKTFQ